jgi:hypothetical protein
MPFPRRSTAGRWRSVSLAALVLAPALALSLAACSDEANPLAPYLGHRDLEFLRVTQHSQPDLQWVGGRVAAVGVNRGAKAALDSTLIWIRTATDNSISSIVAIDSDFDAAFVESVGGTPQESLMHDETYTFWIADASVIQAGLDPAAGQPGDFEARTMKMNFVVGGIPRSAMGVVFTIRREERIVSDYYVISWTPEDVALRRLVINNGTSPGWTDHIWHILTPDDQPPSITSPVVIGLPPEGTVEVTPWPEDGFPLPECPRFQRTHMLWAVTDAWNETLSWQAPGFAQRLIRFPDLICPPPET